MRRRKRLFFFFLNFLSEYFLLVFFFLFIFFFFFFIFFFSTLAPSLVELTSKSSNKPFISYSLLEPFAEFSILLKTLESVSLRFASLRAFLRTFAKSSLGKI